MKNLKTCAWISSLVIAFLCVGCDGQSSTSSADTPPAAPSEEALVILAKADSVDGSEDQVVSKCLTCALSMSGSTDHVSTFGDYELHLCSAGCKKRFDGDPEKAVLAVTPPVAPE
jgi:hypothetical protein